MQKSSVVRALPIDKRYDSWREGDCIAQYNVIASRHGSGMLCVWPFVAYPQQPPGHLRGNLTLQAHFIIP